MTPFHIMKDIGAVWVVGIIMLVAINQWRKRKVDPLSGLNGDQRKKATLPMKLSWLVLLGMVAFAPLRIGYTIWQVKTHGGDPNGKKTCYYKFGTTKRSYRC